MKVKAPITEPVDEAGTTGSEELSENGSAESRIRWRIVYLSVIVYTILLILALHLLNVSSAEALP